MKRTATVRTRKVRGKLNPRQTTPEELVQVFRPFVLFPRHALDYLAVSTQALERSSGSVIFRERSESTACFFILSGRVILNKTALTGKDFIIDIVTPGNPFGLVDCLQRVPYSFSARAHTSSQLLSIPREPFSSLLTEYPMVFREMMHLVSDRWRHAFTFSVALAHDLVERRVALVLLRLIAKFSPTGPEDDRPRIELTRLELSELAGCTPETASRVAKSLERSGCISLSQQGVITVEDRDSLIKLAHG